MALQHLVVQWENPYMVYFGIEQNNADVGIFLNYNHIIHLFHCLDPYFINNNLSILTWPDCFCISPTLYSISIWQDKSTLQHNLRLACPDCYLNYSAYKSDGRFIFTGEMLHYNSIKISRVQVTCII